jgi:aspartate 1-decarboxylase
VLAVSTPTGERIETYVIPGERDSDAVIINGAAAHRIRAGEEIIIMGFELAAEPLEPKIILVDRSNRFVEYLPFDPNNRYSANPSRWEIACRNPGGTWECV